MAIYNEDIVTGNFNNDKPTWIVRNLRNGYCDLEIIEHNGHFASGRYTERSIKRFGKIISKSVDNWRAKLK